MLTEMLAYSFMQRALIAGLLIGILCSLISFFVVIKRLSFVGVGVSHSTLGGISIGLLLGVNPILTGAIFALLVAWLIGFISQKGAIHEDVSIGILFSAAMALGILLISFGQSYYGNIYDYLFGNILAVTAQDLWILGFVSLGVIIFITLFFKELLFLCFDPETAQATGLPINFLYYGLLTIISITVVMAVKVVGIVLTSALLVIPAAIGLELTKNYRLMLALAVSSALIANQLGLWLSFKLGTASGATIVLLAALFFLLAFILSPHRGLFARFVNQVGRHFTL